MSHAQIDIWVIPLTFFLLPGATKAIYTCAFTILLQALSLLPDNNNAKKTPYTFTNPPAAFCCECRHSPCFDFAFVGLF
ncbi:hypothetical protein DSO57_1000941 [Entomophthora muscae]|uniref:Uncharacterized protein n=1 Tax=Entomophthora muscae TaxID=34485 RepID=A0ACC2TKH8_9FUNG|nr:hypothetical protein DSO57_1000941 [Entomophthora muscae]